MYSLLLVGVAVLHLIFRFLMRYTMIGASRKIEYDMRNDFFSHLLRLPMAFYNNYKTGDLMARATNDLNAVRNVLGPGIMHGFGNSMLFILVVTLMLITDVKLTLLALLPLPFITLAAKFSIKHIFRIFKQAQAQYSTITAKAQENIAGMRVVKAYVQEENESVDFDQLNKKYLDLNLKLTRIQALLFSSLTFLMGIGTIILIWYGGHLVARDDIEIGDFIAFTVWLGMLAWPMISFGWIMNMIQQGAASMSRLMEIMDVEPHIKDNVNTDTSIRGFAGDIEFRDVSYSYGDDLP
ncbi:ABC transporter ATP-binding protein, partial [candidate division KSB1 bacterium]|nr:ABC transporter ATP-binding protein [candidate division KSB1 bacterium]